MSGYVELGEVHTYYEKDGEGDPLVLLHPGLADLRAFESYLPERDLAGYPGPALVMVGDSDEEIPMSHTLALREGLPNAQLAVLPGAGHGEIDTMIVIDFLTKREKEA
jgi:pimeloyl-ACP methyl ester carboxylesterase